MSVSLRSSEKIDFDIRRLVRSNNSHGSIIQLSVIHNGFIDLSGGFLFESRSHSDQHCSGTDQASAVSVEYLTFLFFVLRTIRVVFVQFGTLPEVFGILSSRWPRRAIWLGRTHRWYPVRVPMNFVLLLNRIARRYFRISPRISLWTFVIFHRRLSHPVRVHQRGMDSTTVYAIIAGVAAFILIVVTILFIVLYYRIQRAKHRVPPFFQSGKHSPAHGLAFLKSKSPLSPSSPYILDVRDDDSSNSTSSDRTTSSPLHNRLLSGHYKVTEPPVNTTIEELLSSYDNRSTSSSSSSSGLGDQILSPSILGTFRAGPRVDQQQLDTINEDLQWMNTSSRPLNSSRVSRPSDDAMDIISESHEVEHRRELLTNCVACPSSLPLTTTTTSTSTHFFFSLSPCSSTDSSHTLETNCLTNSNRACISPQASTRCWSFSSFSRRSAAVARRLEHLSPHSCTNKRRNATCSAGISTSIWLSLSDIEMQFTVRLFFVVTFSFVFFPSISSIRMFSSSG